MRLANNNGLTIKNSQIRWIRQDLVAEAADIAYRIRKARSKPYQGELTSYGPMRMRIPKATKQTIKRLVDLLGHESSEIREDLACEIETRLGVNTKVNIGRWWITAK